MNRRAWLRRSSAGLASLISLPKIEAGSAQQVVAGNHPIVLPHPKSIDFGSRTVELAAGGRSSVSIELKVGVEEEAAPAARIIAGELTRRTGQQVNISLAGKGGGFPIRLSGFDLSRSGRESRVEGGYRLAISPEGAQIESRGVGFAYAAATFTQLIEGGRTARLHEVEIVDWPDFPWRGLYIEVSSAACMGLQDWEELIEWAAFLKLNTVVVGLYNCWQRPGSVLDSEYFLFPSHKYPEFKTPVRTYDRQQGKWVEQVGFPAIYHEDFFGEIVAFGKAHGVLVCPYFASLSHNTLIPRLMPEISMKDEHCRPIGYGFCTTCPKTYEVLFDLYDEIIARYARPNGITTFHAGMDEVAHACRCPDCRVAWKGENNFYVNHLVKIARHLKERGMTRILIWHDMLHRSGLINRELDSRLSAEGLDGLITLCWWTYSAPQKGVLDARDSFGRAFFRPKTQVAAWACPSAGWDTTRPLGASLRTSNQALDWLLRRARDRGAGGVLSYSNHDPMFQQGYVNLSQYAWNQTPTLKETQARYARWLFGEYDEAGLKAFNAYRRVYEVQAGLVDSFYRRPAPPFVGQALASTALREDGYRDGIRELKSAIEALGKIRTKAEDPKKAKMIGLYRVEARRLVAFLSLAFGVLQCSAAYDRFRDERSAGSFSVFVKELGVLRDSWEAHSDVMQELESLRYSASLPRFMVYEAKAHEDFERFVQLYSEIEKRVRNGQTDYLPELVVARGELFGADIGMVLPRRKRGK